MNETMNATKFCKFCGQTIPTDAIICTHCGRQVEKMQNSEPVIINNTVSANAAAASSSNSAFGRACSKWVALLLCFFLGFVGGHKFYEGKIGLGLLYVFTFGGFLIGWIVDFLNILGKPDPYYVN